MIAPRVKSLYKGNAPCTTEFIAPPPPPSPLVNAAPSSTCTTATRTNHDKNKRDLLAMIPAGGGTLTSSTSMRHILSLSAVALSQEITHKKLLVELEAAVKDVEQSRDEASLQRLRAVLTKFQAHFAQTQHQNEPQQQQSPTTKTSNSRTAGLVLSASSSSPSSQSKPSPLAVPRFTLQVHDKATRREHYQPFANVTLHRATYAANAPSEDYSTAVVLGNNNNHHHHHHHNNNDAALFCGVWDGHGGPSAAHFTATHVYEHYARARNTGQDVATAFTSAFTQTDRAYYQYITSRLQDNSDNDSNNNNSSSSNKTKSCHPAVYFAGTCATACWIDVSQRVITCANLGDCRAVVGIQSATQQERFDTVALSVDHSAACPAEQARLKAEHPNDKTVLVNTMRHANHNHDDEDEDEDDDDDDDDDNHDETLDDWRVKGIAAFTRSIGDLHLKEKNTAALFNSYVPVQQRIYPRPGIRDKESGQLKRPYISTTPDVQTCTIPPDKDGFLIIACDGVWDEMSNKEAVQIVADLLQQHPQTDIAAMFIDVVLQKAVQRIKRQCPEEEKDLTIEELRARPVGKASEKHRAMLHDDITVIIVQLQGSSRQTQGKSIASWSSSSSSSSSLSANEEEESVATEPTSNSTNGSSNAASTATDTTTIPVAVTGTTTAPTIDEEGELSLSDLQAFVAAHQFELEGEEKDRVDNKGNVDTDDSQNSSNHWASISSFTHRASFSMSNIIHWFQPGSGKDNNTTKSTAERQSTDQQIIQMMTAFDDLQSKHLRMLFSAVDADENGTLDRAEISRLIKHVMQMDVSPAVLDLAFLEMDADGSGDVDFEEFGQFFGH